MIIYTEVTDHSIKPKYQKIYIYLLYLSNADSDLKKNQTKSVYIRSLLT